MALRQLWSPRGTCALGTATLTPSLSCVGTTSLKWHSSTLSAGPEWRRSCPLEGGMWYFQWMLREKHWLVALIENTAHMSFPHLKIQVIPIFPGVVVVITNIGDINPECVFDSSWLLKVSPVLSCDYNPKHAKRQKSITWFLQKLRLLEVWESIKMVDCSTERHWFLVCQSQKVQERPCISLDKVVVVILTKRLENGKEWGKEKRNENRLWVWLHANNVPHTSMLLHYANLWQAETAQREPHP